jgi:hypothetical protein
MKLRTKDLKLSPDLVLRRLSPHETQPGTDSHDLQPLSRPNCLLQFIEDPLCAMNRAGGSDLYL